jgi:hypothetical protein
MNALHVVALAEAISIRTRYRVGGRQTTGICCWRIMV